MDPAFEREKPDPDAKLVGFMADHVFCNRSHSAGLVSRGSRLDPRRSPGIGGKD
jgi:hypothetical protein